MQKKYEEVVAWIKGEMHAGRLKQGDKLPSESVLQKQFSVSRQTVRRALAVLEEEKITRSIRGSGTYIEIRRKQKQETMRIAVMCTYLDIYIFPLIVKEMEKVISDAGYTLQIAATNNAIEKERMILKSFIKDKSIDGLIAETTKSGIPNPNLALYQELEQMGIPVIFINSFYKELRIPHVSLNDKMAGKMVTQHLLDCGHMKIAGIFKADDGQGHARYAGYVEALMEADIKVKGKQIIWIDSDELEGMREDCGRILRRIRNCTACVCYNDEVANKLVGICMEQGIRIPEDLSIAGIDNSDLARFCEIPFTSAENPIRELGKVAGEKILERIRGNEGVESVELKPKLIMRNSVKVITNI
ncbi:MULTISPECIES: GntR family transcriptional regulator [Sellimonas]|uniref:GntR family transcriptional regulator n=1 Tax=Sellimonas caecigallum TaxID=2592333 RepID=A0ABS7L5Q3_9FIRM|nr:GntR family transcriptional regulator [Sellimonas caecigallum]MBY0758371.1 GntR family transcriptional regulator [Sellimonas caecigallum]OUP03111.1 arabinose metabolism transcriptional repressor [Drancourtella sp. An210]OUP65530.1 arabinose metabolism transcriptional repressor [Drancourtella sp. An177]